jgi:hypothetical protein
LFEALVLANAMSFGVLFMRGGAMRTFARELLVLGLPFAAFGLPQDVGRIMMPYFTRTSGFHVALSLLLVICSMRWFRVITGCTGAVGLMILVAFMSPGAPLHAYLQTGVIFVLTHSLAWREKTLGTQFVRSVAGFFWVLNAAVWVHDYGLKTDVGVTLSALLLLVTWFVLWRVGHERPDLMVAGSATAVTMCAPTDWLMMNGSTGLSALVVSALLFAIGFAVAWTRHRWERVRL